MLTLVKLTFEFVELESALNLLEIRATILGEILNLVQEGFLTVIEVHTNIANIVYLILQH